MPSAPSRQDLVVFLTSLHGFFEACGPDIDAALADHFGEDTAVDWIIATAELFIEGLTAHPSIPASTSELSGALT